MNGVAMLVLGAAGVPVGSFLNVVIDRTPDKAALRGPRDGEPASPIEGLIVPLQPWLLRGGRSRRVPLPTQWLWVEVVTASLFALFGARFGDDLIVAPLLILVAALVAVSVIDLRLLRIPDRVTFPSLAISVPAVLAVSLRHDAIDSFAGALVGAATYFLVLLIPHLIYPRGMGFGDVKLALLMGLYLGWLGWSELHPFLGPIQFVLYGLMLGCGLGVIFGLTSSVVTKRRGEFPFGPALALACVIVALYAPELRV